LQSDADSHMVGRGQRFTDKWSEADS
jgi:hypothetical protein